MVYDDFGRGESTNRIVPFLENLALESHTKEENRWFSNELRNSLSTKVVFDIDEKFLASGCDKLVVRTDKYICAKTML